MNQINDIIDILLQVELYKKSDKYLKDKEYLEKYLKEHGTPVKNNVISF